MATVEGPVTAVTRRGATDVGPAEQRLLWQSKPAVRAVYEDYFNRLSDWCRPGRTLEIGAGSGNLAGHLPDVVSSDIVAMPWLDIVADAHALPFAPGSLANVVMIDTLHHLARPGAFLAEAERVLTPRGRLIVLEPGITPLSGLFYRLFHPEPVDFSFDPLDGVVAPDKDPAVGNQAIPERLFGRDRGRIASHAPTLRLVARQRLSLLAYPASGGFRKWSLLPRRLVKPVLRLEDAVMPLLGPLAAFRLLAVLERGD